MEALSVSDIPVAAIAELFVAAVLSWICFSIHKTLRTRGRRPRRA
jgi:hypothetical protein